MAGGYALAAMSKNLAGFENKNLAENIFGMGFEKKVGKKTVSLASVACGYGGFNQPCMALALNVTQSRRNDLLDEGLTQYEGLRKISYRQQPHRTFGHAARHIQTDEQNRARTAGRMRFEPLRRFYRPRSVYRRGRHRSEKKPCSPKNSPVF